MALNLHPAISVIGLIWAVVASGMLIDFWRKSNSLYALLVEGANRYEELRQLNRSLETSMQNADQKLSDHRQSVERLQNELVESRQAGKANIETLTAKELENKTIRDKFEGQKRYLETELQKAEVAVRAVQAEREQLKAILAEEKSALASQAAAQKTTFEQKLEAITSELTSKNHRLEDIEQKFSKVDPVEIAKVKRKIHHYERLYQSMKGLREMTDERNRNWEIALEKLSHWILAESGVVRPRKNLPQEIGPLVGLALQSIGAQLIDDNEAGDEADPTITGAEVATTMDEPQLDNV